MTSNGAGGTVDHPEQADRSPICAAPFVAMEFDPFGDVLACCANTLHPLGNVRRSTLREIWDGPRAAALRDALVRGDLSHGCSVCRYRLTYGYGELARDYYDNFPMPSDGAEWPYSLQFSLHNTCNLECVMCGADRSSKIRTRRSHLDPLPHAYGERFFDELEPFLEHCGAVDFSGGEPFLVREHQRVWDMIIGMERRPLCSLTTNGTVWNERVERVLDSIDTHISVSVDGMTASTLESIRVGADFDTVMENLDRFVDYTRERGTVVTMSWSLVRQNWWELGAAMRFAEERGIQVKVQTVIEPEFGVQRLPTPQLRMVVESLEEESRSLLPDLELNRPMWEREVGRLRTELHRREQPGPTPLCMEPAAPANAPHVAEMILTTMATVDTPTASGSEHAETRARADLARWTNDAPQGSIDVSSDGVVLAIDMEAVVALAPGCRADLLGATLADTLRSMERPPEQLLWIAEEFREGDRMAHLLWLGAPTRDKVGVLIRILSVATPEHLRLLVSCDTSLSSVDRELAPTPVALSPTRRVGS